MRSTELSSTRSANHPARARALAVWMTVPLTILAAVFSTSCGGSDSARAPHADAGDAGTHPVEPSPAPDAGSVPAPEPAPEPAAPDSGSPPLSDADAGVPRPDAGTPQVTVDAGAPTPSPADAGTPPALGVDAGADAAVDAGPPVFDAASPFDAAPDATTPVDVEVPPLETNAAFPIDGSFCGAAFSSDTETLWLYPCSGAELLSFDVNGSPLASIPRPGESANDVDIDVAPVAFSFAGVEISAGSLLFTNGETDAAEIYALDPATGAVLATLESDFGTSHVVGGAYHPARGEFYAVQDRVPGGDLGNLIAALTPETGAVLTSWSVAPDFSVNYGDIDVCLSTGNLMLVSSDETSIGEFTPEGTFIAKYPLPEGPSALSGIALDDSSGRVWVVSSSGGVWRFDGGPCALLDE